jgi:hypothetical protein
MPSTDPAKEKGGGGKESKEGDDAPKTVALDAGDLKLLATYGVGPYTRAIKKLEGDINDEMKRIVDLIGVWGASSFILFLSFFLCGDGSACCISSPPLLPPPPLPPRLSPLTACACVFPAPLCFCCVGVVAGVKESDTGLAPPSMWDLRADEQLMKEEAFLQVARCTKIINAGQDDAKYMVTIRQYAKYVVKLGEKVSPTDIEEGMRVGVTPAKYEIKLPLPPRIDPSVTMMQVEEKPDVTYDDVGGATDALEKLREVVEMPLLHPERFVALGIDPPKVRLYSRALPTPHPASSPHQVPQRLLAPPFFFIHPNPKTLPFALTRAPHPRACSSMAPLARGRPCQRAPLPTARMRASSA